MKRARGGTDWGEFCHSSEAMRRHRLLQGAETVQILWTGVGGVENE